MMKDGEARRKIGDILNQIDLLEAYDLRLPKKHARYHGFGLKANMHNSVPLRDVVEAILEHLGLELDYEEPKGGHIVLAKKGEPNEIQD
jgi:hypothetical protein